MSRQDALHEKRLRFANEYLIDLNGAAAAVRAGFSALRAKQTAHELLQREDVKAVIAAGQAKVAAGAEARGRDARAELEDIAFVDCGTPLKDAPPALLNVKRAALVDVLKLDGRFKERVEHTGKDGGPIQTEELSDLEAARRVAFLLASAARKTP